MNKVSTSPRKSNAYDPKKDYKWEPTDEFVLSGEEFSVVFNTIKEDAFSPAGISAAQKISVYNVLNQIFLAGIQAGVIVPVEEIKQEEEPSPLAPN